MSDRRSPLVSDPGPTSGTPQAGPIPTALGQEPRVNHPGQPDRLFVEDTDVAEHVRRALTRRRGGRHGHRASRRRGAHRAVPAWPAGGDWAPRPPQRVGGTGRDADTPVRRTPRRARAGRRPHRCRCRYRGGCCRRRAAADAGGPGPARPGARPRPATPRPRPAHQRGEAESRMRSACASSSGPRAPRLREVRPTEEAAVDPAELYGAVVSLE